MSTSKRLEKNVSQSDICRYLFNLYSGCLFFSNLYFWDRERHSMSRERAERQGDTECEAGSRLWAVSTDPDTGLELVNWEIMTWAKVRCSTDWATQVPLNVLIMLVFIFVLCSAYELRLCKVFINVKRRETLRTEERHKG